MNEGKENASGTTTRGRTQLDLFGPVRMMLIRFPRKRPRTPSSAYIVLIAPINEEKIICNRSEVEKRGGEGRG